MAEILTIIGLLVLAGISMWLLPDGAKEIVVSVTSGLLGYLKGVSDGKAEGQEIKVPLRRVIPKPRQQIDSEEEKPIENVNGQE